MDLLLPLLHFLLPLRLLQKSRFLRVLSGYSHLYTPFIQLLILFVVLPLFLSFFIFSFYVFFIEPYKPFFLTHLFLSFSMYVRHYVDSFENMRAITASHGKKVSSTYTRYACGTFLPNSWSLPRLFSKAIVFPLPTVSGKTSDKLFFKQF